LAFSSAKTLLIEVPPKYSRKVITQSMLDRLGQIVNDLCQKWQCELPEFGGEPDHIHVVFRFFPQMQLSKFVNNIKSVTSRRIREEFPSKVSAVYGSKKVFSQERGTIASQTPRGLASGIGLTITFLAQFPLMPSAEITTPEQIRDLFDRIAPNYDQLNQILSLGLHRIWKGMTVLWARPPRGGRVLDVCCGSGDLALLLARQVGGSGQVYGLDFSAPLLAIAQARSHRLLPHHSIVWKLGDALRLPFPENSFAAVTMGYGLRNVTSIPQALSEIHRVLQPGSWAAILDFHRPEHASVQQLQHLYLTHVVVPTATKLGLYDEYAYISASLEHFPTRSQQLDLAAAAGFGKRQFFELAFGLMGVLVVQKDPL
jgi:demethylmenaquinone methyltransferase/2-methoxy-6-polyprenyl-1,4-benzoquinol methylase